MDFSEWFGIEGNKIMKIGGIKSCVEVDGTLKAFATYIHYIYAVKKIKNID